MKMFQTLPVTIRNGTAGQIPLAEPVGVDHEAFLVCEGPAPLDAASNKLAPSEVRHGRAIF